MLTGIQAICSFGEPGRRSIDTWSLIFPSSYKVMFTLLYFLPATLNPISTSIVTDSMFTVGATLFTVTLVITVVVPPSSSVTVRVTENIPSSPYWHITSSVIFLGLTVGLRNGSGPIPSL